MEAPIASECEIVVPVSCYTVCQPNSERLYQPFGEFARHLSLVDLGQEPAERFGKVGRLDSGDGAGGRLEERRQRPLPLKGEAELRHVLVGHAGKPINSVCRVGREAGNRNRCQAPIWQRRGACECMRPAA